MLQDSSGSDQPTWRQGLCIVAFFHGLAHTLFGLPITWLGQNDLPLIAAVRVVVHRLLWEITQSFGRNYGTE
jgi:hypothetical protein